MDKKTFQRLVQRARIERVGAPDYFAGYERGLRRAHLGNAFGTTEEHAGWMRTPNQHTSPIQAERMRGYRDAYAGREPDPDGTRPRSGSQTRPPRVSLGMAPAELVARIDAAAASEGISRLAWITQACEAKLG